MVRNIANWFFTLKDQSEVHEARADFLASRYLLARGQATRGIRLSESSLVELDAMNGIYAVKFVTRKGISYATGNRNAKTQIYLIMSSKCSSIAPTTSLSNPEGKASRFSAP